MSQEKAWIKGRWFLSVDVYVALCVAAECIMTKLLGFGLGRVFASSCIMIALLLLFLRLGLPKEHPPVWFRALWWLVIAAEVFAVRLD